MNHSRNLLLGSVLLDPGRWSKGRVPQIVAGDWNDRIRKAGFSGWELWEPHDPLFLDDDRLPAPQPVDVYNTYVLPGEADLKSLQALANRVYASKARGVKFNVGNGPTSAEAALPALEFLLEVCPNVEFWCECHPRTALEKPENAARWISGLSQRIGIVLHPFDISCNAVEMWTRLVGDRIRHLHFQVKGKDNRFANLATRESLVRDRLLELDDFDFIGSASLEFTRGVGGGAGDEPEALFASAVEDLRFLKSLGWA
ncbi:MAG: hypothetical protein JJU29_17620 [Verrucomicrobia bacterium]|nr:hypothetical protein [Verrucomicrobiota bacterium]MCH8512885.1 hypothetical protein [Kiritimatiellia bacterium]